MGGLHREREAYGESSCGRILGRRHRAPATGRRAGHSNPGPHERVVFLAHFIRGLGFPLHPFVSGLMFYYGLDFHDLAPNFVLNILAFIVVCEAFLRIRPHFGLWLQTFCVKPKVVSGQQAECGGAMVGRMPNVTWLDSSFADTVKGWQSGWFYIIEPHGANWVVAPKFRSGSPLCGSPPGRRRACPGAIPRSWPDSKHVSKA